MSCLNVTALTKINALPTKEEKNNTVLGKRKAASLGEESLIASFKKVKKESVSLSSIRATYECVKCSLAYSMIDSSDLQKAINCNFEERTIKQPEENETNTSVDLLKKAFMDLLNKVKEWEKMKENPSQQKVEKFLKKHNEKFGDLL